MIPLTLTSTLASADDEPYVSYAYSYPHKSAYGPLTPTIPLRQLWQAEQRDSLFLYIHIPFCEMRCGFCNLFTQANADDSVIARYLDALELQATVVAGALGEGTFSRFAIGGGTPTVLSEGDLDSLLEGVDRRFGISPAYVPTSVETSPQTSTTEKLAVLRRHGVSRISIGVQSFLEKEAHAIGRPQQTRDVHAALERLRDFPILNLDLIYGQPHQTVKTWESSLATALSYDPEELFLYPLYVRPETGSGKRGLNRSQSDDMRQMYRVARDCLLSAGYEQVSMRCFRKVGLPSDGRAYCCQRDGMVGLGCGARSYTTHVHYATPFAVEATAVRAITQQWIQSSDQDYAHAHWGVRLREDERRRRYVIQSLLHAQGVSNDGYAGLFERSIHDDFPQLSEWHDRGWLVVEQGTHRLTAVGLELSDWIGPALYSHERFAELREFAA